MNEVIMSDIIIIACPSLHPSTKWLLEIGILLPKVELLGSINNEANDKLSALKVMNKLWIFC